MAAKKKSSFKKYNLVRDFEGTTHVMPISYPGIGLTEDTLTIRSRYAKEFRAADAKASRQLSSMAMAAKGKPLDSDIIKDIEDRAFAALVADWSFDEECNEDNVVEFLRDNPNIFDEINSKAAQDSLFLKSKETP